MQWLFDILQRFFFPLKELDGRWSDIDDDGMNSRIGALFRDAEKCVMTKKGDRYTKIKISGSWQCKYTGKKLRYGDIDVDHIVPKRYAKENKNGLWTAETFTLFANDMNNLICVENTINRSKGAKSIVEWKPERNRKWYAQKWKEICDKWDIEHP